MAWAAAELGITFDRWQSYVVTKMLRHDRDGDLIHRTALFSTARQNGKSVIVRAFYGWLLDAGRMLYPFSEWRDIRAAAHDAKQARIIYRSVYTDLEHIPRLTAKAPLSSERGARIERPPVRLTRNIGIETDTLYLDTLTSEPGSARGLSIGALAFDEVLTQRDFDMWEAVKPTQMAQVSPLLILTSTAGHADSVVLRTYYDRLRRLATGDEPPDPTFYGAWWESANEDVGLEWTAIRQANPSPRISRQAIQEEYRVFPRASWRRERLNHFVDEVIPGAFAPGLWAACRLSAPLAGHPGPFALGVDIQPRWERATIVVAGVREDGRMGVEVFRDIRATEGNPISAAQLIAAVQSFPSPVAVVGFDQVSGAAASFQRHADDTGDEWRAYKPHEVVSASMDATEMILSARLAVDDPLLDAQIPFVARRQIGTEGAFRFSRAASGGPIDGIMAMTFAVHGMAQGKRMPAIY